MEFDIGARGGLCNIAEDQILVFQDAASGGPGAVQVMRRPEGKESPRGSISGVEGKEGG